MRMFVFCLKAEAQTKEIQTGLAAEDGEAVTDG